MLQRVRESLALLLIALLPLHALLVTVGTKMIVGPGHAPLTALSMWKEGMVLVLCALVVLEWIFGENQKSEIRNNFQVPNIAIDWLDTCIIGLFIIALFLFYPPSSILHPPLLGFKYTLFPLLTFTILRRVPWSEEFLERTQQILLGMGVIVALYGIFTFFLPMRFFVWLGYSDLHSLYLPGEPLAAFQQIGESGLRRIQSTFSGPNQMGVWLLIPLGILFMRMSNGKRGLLEYWVIGILGTALVMTFSRAAWVGALVMMYLAMYRTSYIERWVVQRMAPAVFVCALFLLFLFPNILLRSASTLDHIRRPMEAVRVMMEYPLGLGLGSAGPATNRLSDPCVYLVAGAEASWVKDHPDLCVFVGDTQVQPQKPCHCPFLPENWYLQVGVELGVIGFIIFVFLIVTVTYALRPTSYALFSFLGVSVAALFLHAWEDSAVAYTVWLLLAAILPVAPRWGRS